MQEQIRQVSEFMQLCGQETPENPTISTPEVRTLRIQLQQEELDEMKRTLNSRVSPDNLDCLTQLADDIADQLYVLFGAINAFGLQDYISAVFEEVHNSNMTKTHETQKEAIVTQNHWIDKKEIRSTVREINKRWCVISLEGKLLKNVNYRPANLQKVFDNVQATKDLLTKDNFVSEAITDYEND